MAVYAETPIELVQKVYSTLDARLGAGRERLGRALTLAEKILINHLDDFDTAALERGASYEDTAITSSRPASTARPTCSPRSTRTKRSTTSSRKSAPATTPASGPRAQESSTRSCWRTTPSA